MDMKKLTKKDLKELPDSAFALPGRRFPIPDKSHARNALSRASEGIKKGWITKSEYDTIVRKANRVLEKDEVGSESLSTNTSLWYKSFK